MASGNNHHLQGNYKRQASPRTSKNCQQASLLNYATSGDNSKLQKARNTFTSSSTRQYSAHSTASARNYMTRA